MSITFTNFDSSYFDVKYIHTLGATPPASIAANMMTSMSDSIISFSINEEANRIINGSVKFHDPDDSLSSLLRPGRNVDVEWGYRKPDAGMALQLQRAMNTDQVWGPYARKGIRAYVMGPSGEAAQNGTKTFSMNFYGRELLSEGGSRRYGAGWSRAGVIRRTLRIMGINPARAYVDFRRNLEGNLTNDTACVQVESNFRFLMRLAVEWRAVFRIGYDADGNMGAIFCDPDKIDEIQSVRAMVGATFGGSIRIDWKGGGRNLISFTWRNNATGAGDNVQILMGPNGQPQIYRTQATTETTTTYVLNTQAIATELRRRGLEGQIELMAQWLSASTWEEVRPYFTPVTAQTAPQGGGYTLSGRMIGNPMLTAPMKLQLGDGFPDILKDRNRFWYCNKVTHTIDRNGYFCDFEAIDCYYGFLGATAPV